MAGEQLFNWNRQKPILDKNWLTGCQVALSPSNDTMLATHTVPPCSEAWSMSNSGYRWQVSNDLIEIDKNNSQWKMDFLYAGWLCLPLMMPYKQHIVVPLALKPGQWVMVVTDGSEQLFDWWCMKIKNGQQKITGHLMASSVAIAATTAIHRSVGG